jgi:hydrogenase 3 maturation protease
MSRTFWRASLKKKLKPLTENNPGFRLAILGIGNELWGDDGAGNQAARRIQRSIHQAEAVLVIDAGPSPEAYSGVLRRFRPDFVLLIDTVKAGGTPGRISWIEFSDLEGVSALTHGMPLTVLGQFLTSELGVKPGLLGIEGESFELGGSLSLPVRRAVNTVAKELPKIIFG